MSVGVPAFLLNLPGVPTVPAAVHHGLNRTHHQLAFRPVECHVLTTPSTPRHPKGTLNRPSLSLPHRPLNHRPTDSLRVGVWMRRMRATS